MDICLYVRRPNQQLFESGHCKQSIARPSIGNQFIFYFDNWKKKIFFFYLGLAIVGVICLVIGTVCTGKNNHILSYKVCRSLSLNRLDWWRKMLQSWSQLVILLFSNICCIRWPATPIISLDLFNEFWITIANRIYSIWIFYLFNYNISSYKFTINESCSLEIGTYGIVLNDKYKRKKTVFTQGLWQSSINNQF